MWRAILTREDKNEIAFNFIVKDSLHRKIFYVVNAAERIAVDDISFLGDSIFIRMPFFDSKINAVFTAEGELRGFWIKRLADRNQVMPFFAQYNRPERFPIGGLPESNISGRWEVKFYNPNRNDSTQAVGEFQQQGRKVTGTFLHPTGDYRFLEGVVNGDTLEMSCFDGGHAYYFKAKISGDHTKISGNYYSGPTHIEIWKAERNDTAHLIDEFSITKIKSGATNLDFRFKDINGKPVSIKDERFRNKVVLVQIMGSWCPNCLDETRFLSAFYDQYRKKGLEIISLAFERSTDFARSQKTLRVFQQRFNVKYPMLITGVSESDTLKAEKAIPQLESIQGFPTTIFIDRAGIVRKIHTGFNGPATGIHYESEKKIFEQQVESLLKN